MQKVLIVTYYWPPAGGPGVQRWLKFVKYLPEFDFEPIVYIPKDPHYPIMDESLLLEIPEGVRILKKKIVEPYKLAGLFSSKKTKRISSGLINEKKQSLLEKTMLWVRGNFFIPDARKYWVKPSINYLMEFIEKENITTVITSGPPHSLHLIGLGLQAKNKIKWIADFRDPWTQIGYHNKLKLSRYAERKHKLLEYKILNTADTIIVTSPTTQANFEKITSKPVELITNGFDNAVTPTLVQDGMFTISHIGSLLTGRNPKILWEVLSELTQDNEQFAKQLKLRLAGVVSEEVKTTINAFGLERYVVYLGYLPHSEIRALQFQSQVLLLLEIDSNYTQGILPGKLFEYLQAKRPVLAIGPKNWDAGEIIEKTKSGKSYTYTEKEALQTTLLEWFNLYQVGNLQVQSQNIEKYSRKKLTAELAKIL